MEQYAILGIPVLFFFANYLLVYWDQRKYKKNFPYDPYKSKKRFLSRIGLGLLAGFHYLFFIGTYNHKKYNTQVHYPKTLECYFGNISQVIILISYVWISYFLYSQIGLYYLIFLVFPILTNILSLTRKR